MSTATNISRLPHTPHTAYPTTLREHAFTLHCQGLRSPAIAAELGVSERTIRAWIAAALDDLKDDLQLNRRQQLLLAVERQHQLTAIAWQQFEREAAARDALLDASLQTLLAADASSASSAHPLHLHLPASTPAPRYLSLILQANKEINRLLALHTLARLELLAPDVPETDPAPFAASDIPAETATAPTAPTLASAGLAASLSPQEERVGGEVPIPAETAIAITDSQNPAETATDIPIPAAEAVAAVLGASGRFRPEPVSGRHPPQAAGEGRTGRPNLDGAECTDPKIPAETATDSQSAAADFVAARRPGAVSTASSSPAESATVSPNP